MMKMHPDQLDGPDVNGCIRVGVGHWSGPDPVIPGYARRRVELVRVRTPCRIVTYEPVPTPAATRPGPARRDRRDGGRLRDRVPTHLT